MGRSICGLYAGEFQRCVRSLNPKLRICCFDNSPHAAGLYYVDPKEGWISVCGVDKGWVPVATTVDEVGHILKSGWVRVVRLLLAQGLTTQERVRKVWPGFFESRIPRTEFKNMDPILRKIGRFVHEQEDKRGEQGMDADQIMEVAEEIHKKDTDAKKGEDDRSKWELNKALDKGQRLYI